MPAMLASTSMIQVLVAGAPGAFFSVFASFSVYWLLLFLARHPETVTTASAVVGAWAPISTAVLRTEAAQLAIIQRLVMLTPPLRRFTRNYLELETIFAKLKPFYRHRRFIANCGRTLICPDPDR